jgi:hypothetical protein
MRTAANAPVASSWVCALEECVAVAAETDAELAPEALAVEADDVAVEEGADDEVVATFTVAFRVPHFSLLVHVAWPSALFGLLLMHCTKVAWQM